MISMAENIREAERALTEKPIFSTSIERILILNELKSAYRELPQPLRFTRVLKELLERVSVPLEPYDLILGRSVDRELTVEEEALFQSYLRGPDYPAWELFLHSGHGSFSWDKLIELGLPGLRAAAEEGMAHAADEEHRIFCQALTELYDAIAAYMLRYADAAERMGLCAAAERLRLGATSVPDRFGTALQLSWIVTLVNCSYVTENSSLSLGRMDQFLYPLYEKELRDGGMTREEMGDLITDYYCKHNLILGRGEHQLGNAENSTTFQRICNFDSPLYLILAGRDEKGAPAVNDLTQLFAERIQPSFKNPVAVVRYFRDMNAGYPTLWNTLMEKSLASAPLMYYNEDSVFDAYRRMGIPDADCRSMEFFGCNWPSLGARSICMDVGPHAIHIPGCFTQEELADPRKPVLKIWSRHGWPETFVNAMRSFTAAERPPESIEDFYRVFFDELRRYMKEWLDDLGRELTARRRRPSALLSFTDAFFWDAVREGEGAYAAAQYHFVPHAFRMFGTVADCFTVVDRLVYQDHKLTLKQLLDAVDANFEGMPDILALCRNVPKYGSDDAFSNAHAERLAKAYSDIILDADRYSVEKWNLYVCPCLQSDTLHYKQGVDYGATPDGRLAHTSFSQNSAPSNGACVNGLTAMFNSLLHVTPNGYLSGALNLDVDPKVFAGDRGRAMLGTLLAVYFNRGGLHAQISCANVDDLLDAQIHPEQHRDLRVRVTGYSGIFVDICRNLQDDIINRFQ